MTSQQKSLEFVERAAEQLATSKMGKPTTSSRNYFTDKYGSNGKLNKLQEEDFAAHNWYRFVLSYPPHLVRDYIESFKLKPGQVLLDPFCGTGTTIVEAMKNGLNSVGIEANPLAHFACTTKTQWEVNPEGLLKHAKAIAIEATTLFDQPMRVLPSEQDKLLLKKSISPLPLHKTIILLETISSKRVNPYKSHERLAVAKATVFSTSNLHFGPEVGVRGYKKDADVITMWLREIEIIARDLKELQRLPKNKKGAAQVHYADARNLNSILSDRSIDCVITSPPYPNEKDYTRTTRLESVLLGFINNKEELRQLKRGLVKSNTRGIYVTDTDDAWVSDNKNVQKIAAQIEHRRIELGKTSGFEKNYARVTRLYFGGMAKHLADLRPKLKKGALLAYVVGDQASYLRVMIRTGQLLGEIAQELGYELVNIDLFRTRLATATKEQIREEVLVLRWPK